MPTNFLPFCLYKNYKKINFAIWNDNFNCCVYDRKLWSYMHFSLTTFFKDPYFHSIEDEEPIRWLSTCQKICERVILLDCTYMRKRAKYAIWVQNTSSNQYDFCWKTSHKFINVKQIIRLLYIYVITICELCVQLKE